jgi:hypothetical protein
VTTVVLTSASGVTTNTANNLIDNVTYQNYANIPTPGPRDVTLALVVDNGGGAATTNISLTASAFVLSAPTPLPAMLGAQLNPLRIQPFFNGNAMMSNNSFADALTGTTNSASESIYSSSSANYSSNGRAESLDMVKGLFRRNDSIPSWGWANVPAFINLTPIVSGLTVAITTLQIQEEITLGIDEIGSNSVMENENGPLAGLGNKAKPVATPEVKAVDAVASISPEKIKQAFDAQKVEPIKTAKAANGTGPKVASEFDSTRNAAYAQKMNFEQRVKALLRDFGLGE